MFYPLVYWLLSILLLHHQEQGQLVQQLQREKSGSENDCEVRVSVRMRVRVSAGQTKDSLPSLGNGIGGSVLVGGGEDGISLIGRGGGEGPVLTEGLPPAVGLTQLVCRVALL